MVLIANAERINLDLILKNSGSTTREKSEPNSFEKKTNKRMNLDIFNEMKDKCTHVPLSLAQYQR